MLQLRRDLSTSVLVSGKIFTISYDSFLVYHGYIALVLPHLLISR